MFKKYAKNFLEKEVSLPHNTATLPESSFFDTHEEVTTLIAEEVTIKGELTFTTSLRIDGIFEGDLVIVRPTHDVRNNDIVVALLHDEATVKRFIQTKNRSYLKAENPDYKNIYPKEEWMVQGKVVGVIRSLE